MMGRTCRSLAIGIVVLASLVVMCSCRSTSADDPNSPAYRLVTSELVEIETALGTRGGLASLLGDEKPAWPRIGSLVSGIEDNWSAVRLELERRAPQDPSAASASADYEAVLSRLSTAVESKNETEAKIQTDLATAGLEEVKNVLHKADVSGFRLLVGLLGLFGGSLAIVMASRMVVRWRDGRFLLPRKGRPR